MGRYVDDYDDDEGFEPRRKKSSSSVGLIIGLVVGGGFCLLVCCGILIALMLPAVQQARHAARKTSSKNNLKNIGLALFVYESDHGAFPPGGIYDVQTDTDHHSWMTMILPQMDEGPMHRQINFDEPWDSPDNQPIFRKDIRAFVNPGIEDNMKIDGYGAAHYSANSHLFGRNTKTKIRDLTNGPPNTILAAEVNSNFLAWGNPKNYRSFDAGINKGGNSFGSPYEGGVHVMFGDGRVQFISNNIDPETLKNIGSPEAPDDDF